MTAGMIPSFTSEKAKTASGAAIAMSAAATRPAPPPSAYPCTRATTGAGQPSIASTIARSALASATFSSYERSTDERIQSTSAPAEKLGPSPARTTARARPTPTNASASSTTRDRWAEWLAERRFGGDPEIRAQALAKLAETRDRVLDRAELRAGETLLDVGCGEGLIGFGALARGSGS